MMQSKIVKAPLRAKLGDFDESVRTSPPRGEWKPRMEADTAEPP